MQKKTKWHNTVRTLSWVLFLHRFAVQVSLSLLAKSQFLGAFTYSREMRLLSFLTPVSIGLHVTAGLLLEELALNFLFETLIKCLWREFNFDKARQNCRAYYMKTSVRSFC